MTQETDYWNNFASYVQRVCLGQQSRPCLPLFFFVFSKETSCIFRLRTCEKQPSPRLIPMSFRLQHFTETRLIQAAMSD